MLFEWDAGKARANRRKHGADFADVLSVFDDPLAMVLPDDDPEEERCIALGATALGSVLVVVYTWRGEGIRIISARKATGRERARYEKG